MSEEIKKSKLHQQAESIDPKENIAKARFTYLNAFNDYASRGEMKLGTECATKAAALYYRENLYQEAFDLLRRVDQAISSSSLNTPDRASCHYYVTKERFQMYMKMHRAEPAKEHLNAMATQAGLSSDENVKNDFLYNKTIYHYTFGQTTQGNAVFKEMVDKLTKSKEFDKVDEVYKTLIANGRKSNNATLVAQSYSNYIAWKDSTDAIKHADEIQALKDTIAKNEAEIDEKDSSLTTRWLFIVGLLILAGALTAVLLLGAVVLMRYIMQTKKQKKVIELANDSNALKAKFISNMSAQLEPTLKKLDSRQPEVKALLEFSKHVQTLSELENSNEELEMEEVQLQQFCEELMNQIRGTEQSGVQLVVNAPKMSALIYRPYVSHILVHLLKNAAEYTPAEGKITIEFKKRGQHKIEFHVSDTGAGIPLEKREDIFKPFLEIRDLTKGDGLGLPTCKQMALKMGGDLNIDGEYTRGTRFVLELKA
jgi:signal transduction histidine kinase